jgi:hypothetical protein
MAGHVKKMVGCERTSVELSDVIEAVPQHHDSQPIE